MSLPFVAIVSAAINEPDLSVRCLHLDIGNLFAVAGPLTPKAPSLRQEALTRPTPHINAAIVCCGVLDVPLPVSSAADATHFRFRILSKS